MTVIHHSIEIENRVLENLMHIGNPSATRIQKAFLTLTEDCFHTQANRQIFALILGCFQKHQSFTFIDILSLISSSDENLFDAISWLMDQYSNLHISDRHLEADIIRLQKESRLRKQIAIAETMLAEINELPTDDAIVALNRHYAHIGSLNFTESKDGTSLRDLAKSFLDGSFENDLNIATTCKSLNYALGGGIMSKSLIIVAAGAGIGKTGFSIYLLDAIARTQPSKQSLFFSLEMESKHIWSRYVGIRGGKLFEAMTHSERLAAIESCDEIPIQIYDAATCRDSSNIDFITTTARIRAIEQPISVIVVDYLTLVQCPGNFEQNHFKQSEIASRLANLALELNCIVIALSQINRNIANREDKCPWPEDAADSSGGHRSSSIWLGIDRPELYREDSCYQNQFVVKCRKNRFGKQGDFILAFNDGTFSEVVAGYFKSPAKVDKNGYGRPYLDDGH